MTALTTGEALRKRVTKLYALRADELSVLDAACATADMLATLEAEWVEAGKPMTTKGSMGQLVIHPFIGEMRSQRSALAALLRQLKLPDDAGEGHERSNQQRDAANSRWATGRGA